MRGQLTHRVVAGLATIVVLFGPALASACSVCMGGQEEESRQAFVLTTALMTFLPLTVLGIAVWWFLRGALAREEDEARRIAAERRGSAVSEGVAPVPSRAS